MIIGDVRVGSDCRIDPASSIGNCAEWWHSLPNGYSGSPVEVEDQLPVGKVRIGDSVIVREFVTINSGVTYLTIVGSGTILMAHSHVGHDAVVGEHVTIAPHATVGGLAHVGSFSTMGMNSSVHQRSKLPAYSMLGANSFFKGTGKRGLIWAGVPARVIGVNYKANLPPDVLKEAEQEWARLRSSSRVGSDAS